MPNIYFMKTSHFFVASIVVVAGAFLFYWYEYRPLSIRKTCEEVATSLTTGIRSVGFSNKYEMEFEQCLNRFGL